MKPIHVAKTT